MPRNRRERSWGWPEVAIVVLVSVTVLTVLAVLWFLSNINWAGWDF